MNPEADKLYQLLPAIYRIRDASRTTRCVPCARCWPKISPRFGRISISSTTISSSKPADWVAPYIGDLIGYRTSAPLPTARGVPGRKWPIPLPTVAGRATATVLEQLARDVTGWNARAVEFSVARNQSML